MDVVDERAKPIDQNLVKDFIARAPTSAKAVLAVVVFLLVWFLKKHLQELNVSRRERLCVQPSQSQPHTVRIADAATDEIETTEDVLASLTRTRDRSGPLFLMLKPSDGREKMSSELRWLHHQPERCNPQCLCPTSSHP